jgi:hypothetical protein
VALFRIGLLVSGIFDYHDGTGVRPEGACEMSDMHGFNGANAMVYRTGYQIDLQGQGPWLVWPRFSETGLGLKTLCVVKGGTKLVGATVPANSWDFSVTTEDGHSPKPRIPFLTTYQKLTASHLLNTKVVYNRINYADLKKPNVMYRYANEILPQVHSLNNSLVAIGQGSPVLFMVYNRSGGDIDISDGSGTFTLTLSDNDTQWVYSNDGTIHCSGLSEVYAFPFSHPLFNLYFKEALW